MCVSDLSLGSLLHRGVSEKGRTGKPSAARSDAPCFVLSASGGLQPYACSEASVILLSFLLFHHLSTGWYAPPPTTHPLPGPSLTALGPPVDSALPGAGENS